MAERTPANSNPAASPPGATTPPALPPLGGSRPASWRQAWQLPVLMLGVLMLIGWVFLYRGSSGTKFDYPGGLDAVSRDLQAENLDAARDRINRILPHIRNAPPLEQARLKQLWGDLVYLSQKAQGGNLHENHARIVSLYMDAESMGLPLDTSRLRRLADTYIAMGREDEAIKVVGRMKEGGAEARHELVRRMIARRLDAGSDDTKAVLSLLARFEDELRGVTVVAERRPQEVWAAGLRARLMLDAGAPDRAIEYLQRQMIQLISGGGDKDLGLLMAILGEGFQRVNENRKARHWYVEAQKRLRRDDPDGARVLVGLAQLDIAETGDYREALVKFTEAEAQYPQSTTPAHFDALLGRAHCEGKLGVHAQAIEHFGRAVRLATESGAARQADRTAAILASVRSHFDQMVDQRAYEAALDYLSLLAPLYQKDRELPAPVLLEFASTHEKIAAQRLAEAAATAPGYGERRRGAGAARAPANTPMALAPSTTPGGAEASKSSGHLAAVTTQPRTVAPPTKPVPESARKLAFQQAAIHFGKAADYFLRHARAISVADDKAFSASLWSAAECYDRAQLWKEGIKVYSEFVKARPGDPRTLQAMHRLAMSYKADGQFGPAMELFKRLVDDHRASPEAYASFVPLAQCHMQLGDDQAAKRVLQHVLTQNPAVTTGSQAYREALIELGRIHYQKGDFESAIERLSMATDRFGEAPDLASVKFMLADAYRQSAGQIDKTLAEPMPQSRRVELQRERVRRLEQAEGFFAEVINDLDTPGRGALSNVEILYRRNAYFYRADCAFDRGLYESAIGLYDLAARRWENDPASLVALAQIVNAYCKMGRIQEARVANRRARSLLQRIPESAFNDPTLPMTRDHWEAWLKWTSEAELLAPQASAAPRATPVSDR